MPAREGLWLGIVEGVLRGSAGGPGTARWSGLFLGELGVVMRLRWGGVCGQLVQGCGIIEKLKQREKKKKT